MCPAHSTCFPSTLFYIVIQYAPTIKLLKCSWYLPQGRRLLEYLIPILWLIVWLNLFICGLFEDRFCIYSLGARCFVLLFTYMQKVVKLLFLTINVVTYVFQFFTILLTANYSSIKHICRVNFSSTHRNYEIRNSSYSIALHGLAFSIQ